MSHNFRLSGIGRRFGGRLALGATILGMISLLFARGGYALKPAIPPAQPETGPGGSTYDYVVGVAEEHGSMPTSLATKWGAYVGRIGAAGRFDSLTPMR